MINRIPNYKLGAGQQFKRRKNMGRETILFKSAEKKTVAETASVLRAIADKIEFGKITLSSQASEVELVIPENVTLEIKAEEEQGRTSLKRSLEIEIEWNEGDTQGAGNVTIS